MIEMSFEKFINESLSNKSLGEALLILEYASVPKQVGAYLVPNQASHVINGKTVLAKSKMNKGRSGKGFTTIWYVDGNRVSKADLEKSIAA